MGQGKHRLTQRENSCPHCKLKFLEVQMLAEQCLKGKANVFSRNIRDNKNKTFKIGDRKQTDSTDDFDHDLWGQNMDAEQELHLLNLIVQIEEFMEGETDM